MERIVLITSFGPFSGHPVNASSEVMKILQSERPRGLLNEDNIDLLFEFKELPVAYAETKSFISEYWALHPPRLCVHIGVHSEDNIKIESQCNNTKYIKEDIMGLLPAEDKWPHDMSTLPLEKVAEIFNIEREEIEVVLSKDAGTYLCQYCLHNSLRCGNGRAAFIHVPPLSKRPAEITCRVVRRIILSILELTKCEN